MRIEAVLDASIVCCWICKHECAPMSATAQITDSPGLSERPARLDTHCQPWSLAKMFERHRRLPCGTHLFLAGAPSSSVYMVVSGSFKVYATSLQGDEQVLGFFLPGDALALEAVSSQYHVYSAVALEDSEVGEHSLECLQSDLKNLHRLDEHDLLQHLCFATIANNYDALRNRSTKSAEQRLSGFLIFLWDRLDRNDQTRGELALTMSRRDIADYLGLALETISRIFSQLEQQNLIGVRRKFVQILDPDALRRLAGSERSSLPVRCQSPGKPEKGTSRGRNE